MEEGRKFREIIIAGGEELVKIKKKGKENGRLCWRNRVGCEGRMKGMSEVQRRE